MVSMVLFFLPMIILLIIRQIAMHSMSINLMKLIDLIGDEVGFELIHRPMIRFRLFSFRSFEEKYHANYY